MSCRALSTAFPLPHVRSWTRGAQSAAPLSNSLAAPIGQDLCMWYDVRGFAITLNDANQPNPNLYPRQAFVAWPVQSRLRKSARPWSRLRDDIAVSSSLSCDTSGRIAPPSCLPGKGISIVGRTKLPTSPRRETCACCCRCFMRSNGISRQGLAPRRPKHQH